MINMKLTTIQLHEETKKKLEGKKLHSKESYETVLKRMLESESIPSMREMFAIGDSLPQSKRYSTKKVIDMSHELMGKR